MAKSTKRKTRKATTMKAQSAKPESARRGLPVKEKPVSGFLTRPVVAQTASAFSMHRSLEKEDTAVSGSVRPRNRNISSETSTDDGSAHRSVTSVTPRKVADKPAQYDPILKPEDRSTCKARPSEQQSKGGDGGSRPFVPWCDRK